MRRAAQLSVCTSRRLSPSGGYSVVFNRELALFGRGERAPSSIPNRPAGAWGPLGPSEEDIKKYNTDPQALARWLDVTVVKRKGRAFEPDTGLIPAKRALPFPVLECHSLEDSGKVNVPTVVPGQVRLVIFSFKHYGFSQLRSWLDRFLEEFPAATAPMEAGKIPDASAIEICFVEQGFLSMARGLFASGIKKSILPTQMNRTFLSFGAVKTFSAKLLLPNVYTGYVFLLDSQGRVRWQACGEPTESDLDLMVSVAKQIEAEK